jgi:hypothetical protein
VGAFEVGIVLPIMQFGPDRETARWSDLRAMSLRAEEIGFDTIWTPDELLWRMEDGPPRGVWKGVGRSVGVSVRPLDPAGLRPDVISGSVGEIPEAVRAFRDAGFSQLEMMVGPGTMTAFDALAPVVERLHAD